MTMHVEDNMPRGMSCRGSAAGSAEASGMSKTRQAQRKGGPVGAGGEPAAGPRLRRGSAQEQGIRATAILILSLGICANVAIFSFVDAALIKPLPYEAPDAADASNLRATGLARSINLSYPDMWTGRR